MSDTEKGEAMVGHLSNAPSHNETFDDDYTEAERKSIIRRIDRRLVTTAGALYCISLIDRTNLSAAALAGMNVELNLNVENRYSIITLVFFVSYIVFQPPSTIIIRKLGPRLHLSVIILLWGAVMIGMGFAPNFNAMAALRFVLGILEAGFFPSVVYLMSTWYTRKYKSCSTIAAQLSWQAHQLTTRSSQATKLASVTRSSTSSAALPLPLVVSWPLV